MTSPSQPSDSRQKIQQSAQSSDDFYTLLGLRPGASVQDVRRAYRDLSKLYHPDTTELESAIATVKFQALNEAYATLSSPEKRLAYDYKIGYSRLSVMQPLSQQAPSGKPYNPTDSAYLAPTARPLSGGELFALFILGITFVACLILVFTMGLSKSELPITQGAIVLPEVVTPEVVTPEAVIPETDSPKVAPPEGITPTLKPSLAPDIPVPSRFTIETLPLYLSPAPFTPLSLHPNATLLHPSLQPPPPRNRILAHRPRCRARQQRHQPMAIF